MRTDCPLLSDAVLYEDGTPAVAIEVDTPDCPHAVEPVAEIDTNPTADCVPTYWHCPPVESGGRAR